MTFSDEELCLIFNGLIRFEDTLKRSLAKNANESVLRTHYETRLSEVSALKSRITFLIQRND